MDYEKGKKIEDVIYKLKQIKGDWYGGEPMTDLDKIYDTIDSAISDLNRVLGKDY